MREGWIHLHSFTPLFINGYVNACMQIPLSRVQLFVTLWSVAHQVLLSTGFSRQEYWSGLPFPTPGDLPNPGIQPKSLASPTVTGGFFTTEPLGKSCKWLYGVSNSGVLDSKFNTISPVIYIDCYTFIYTFVTISPISNMLLLKLFIASKMIWPSLIPPAYSRQILFWIEV